MRTELYVCFHQHYFFTAPQSYKCFLFLFETEIIPPPPPTNTHTLNIMFLIFLYSIILLFSYLYFCVQSLPQFCFFDSWFLYETSAQYVIGCMCTRMRDWMFAWCAMSFICIQFWLVRMLAIECYHGRRCCCRVQCPIQSLWIYTRQ